MIPRACHEAALHGLLDQLPVVAIIGARQVGKTTLARRLANREERSATIFDLEDPTDEARLAGPKLALEPLRGLLVIDACSSSAPRQRARRERPAGRSVKPPCGHPARL